MKIKSSQFTKGVNYSRLLFLVAFIFFINFSFAQKGDFIGFTYQSSMIQPFTLIHCTELPDLDERTDKNGYFSLLLDTGTYHFNFYFGDGSMHSSLSANNVKVHIEEGQTTIMSVKLEGQMRDLEANLLMPDYYENYFKTIPYVKAHLGLSYDSLMLNCPEQIEYDGKAYEIINAEIINEGKRSLAVDINLPDINTASPFGKRVYCLVEFEKWETNGYSRHLYPNMLYIMVCS